MSTLKVDAITPNVETTTSLGGTTPGLGKVLQVVAGYSSGDGSSTTVMWGMTLVELYITPASTSSRIMIDAHVQYDYYPADWFAACGAIMREIDGGAAEYAHAQQYLEYRGDSNPGTGGWGNHCIEHWNPSTFIDKPNTTKQIKYTLKFGSHGHGAVYVGRYSNHGGSETISENDPDWQDPGEWTGDPTTGQEQGWATNWLNLIEISG